MGQTISCVWRCVRSNFRNETKTLVDPSERQPSHYINIPDGEIEPVSSSIPENVNVNVPCIVVILGNNAVHNKEEEDYVEENGSEKLIHVSSSIPENVTDITPDVPCFVVDLGPDADQKENCVEHCIEDCIEQNGDKFIQVVENKIVKEKEVINKVKDDSKETNLIKRIGQYNSKQKILLVGEGDFSFSASLALAFAYASNIVATSLNSEDFLIENYSNFLTNKMELVTRGAIVVHGVDATTMFKDTFLGSLKFDRIIFNFPHAGKFGQGDSDLRKHKELVRGFIRNAKKMINEDGEIHITHKSTGFYLEWDIPKIGSDHSLRLIEAIKFRRSKYPGYHSKYGFGGDKDFECNPCKTYKFGLLSK